MVELFFVAVSPFHHFIGESKVDAVLCETNCSLMLAAERMKTSGHLK
jgi:hypothetical protein